MNFKQKMRTVLSIVVATTVIGMAFYYKDDLMSAYEDMRPEWMIAGFAFYLLTYFFRALRLRTLSNNGIILWPDSLYCASLHGFATYILPLRSGDFTLPILLKSMSNIELSKGLTILYKARLLDVFTLGIWTLLAGFYPYWTIPRYVRWALCLVGGVMICLPYILKRLFLLLSSDGPVGRFTQKLGSVGKLHWTEIFQSTCIWGALAACFYCIAEAIGLSLQLGAVWLLIVIQMPLQLIPLQGLANSGNHEGGWVAGLKLLGFSTETAFQFALMSHAVLLLFVLSLGPVLLVFGWVFRNRKI